MSLRYLAFVWSPSDISSDQIAKREKMRLLARNPSWCVELEKPGMLVCVETSNHSADKVIRLQNQAGLIVGRLFGIQRHEASDVDPQISTLSTTDGEGIVSTAGKSLTASHWGSYVLFLSTMSGNAHVLRGPMSAMPCFWAGIDGLTIFFSSVEDYLAIAPRPLSINWECIRAQSAAGDYLTRETALREISTLISGECLEVSGVSRSHRSYWNPAMLEAQAPIENLKDAATLLGSTTRFCVRNWMSSHRTLLLQLSGGLDSSILLACMAHANARDRIIAVNFYSPGPGDERKYARSMTEKHGIELVEMESNRNVDLRKFLDCARTANPVLNFSAFDVEPRLVEFAHQRNATAIVNGEIGDDMFGHAPAPEALAECFASYGLGVKSWRAALDFSELTRVSLWKALRQSRHYLRWRNQSPYWSFYKYRLLVGQTNDRHLVADESIRAYEQSITRFIHPWFADTRNMPAGRAMLIHALIMATSTWSHSPFAGDDASLFMSPLASQPMVEAFVQIPSYLHFWCSENGAVAREAFRQELSELVLNRGTGKGTPESWIRGLIDRNRDFLKELLLEGVLVREGILDHTKVERMLSGDASRIQVGVSDLVRQLYIEAWLRRWVGVEKRAAA